MTPSTAWCASPARGSRKTLGQLDGVGNWASRKGVANQANNMNEYTSFAGVPQLHDDNGNLIDDGTNRYQYDFANRLRKVIRKADNAVIAVYRYDAHNRRNEKIVTHTTGFDDQVRYLYDGWQEFEERRATSTQQYVYAMWIDEPLTLDKDTNNDGVMDQSFFYHQDEKTYVVALTDRIGGVVERTTYDAYGVPNPQKSQLGNPLQFTGRRWEAETRQYYYRVRFYQPLEGRFIGRDPVAIRWLNNLNLLNLYTYVRNSPVNYGDPMGLDPDVPEELWSYLTNWLRKQATLGSMEDNNENRGLFDCGIRADWKRAKKLLKEIGVTVATTPYQVYKLLSGEAIAEEIAKKALEKLAKEEAKKAIDKLNELLKGGWNCKKASIRENEEKGGCGCDIIFCYNAKKGEMRIQIEGKVGKQVAATTGGLTQEVPCCKPFSTYKKVLSGTAKKGKEPFTYDFKISKVEEIK
jgi:RHS repeat-associated protein